MEKSQLSLYNNVGTTPHSLAHWLIYFPSFTHWLPYSLSLSRQSVHFFILPAAIATPAESIRCNFARPMTNLFMQHSATRMRPNERGMFTRAHGTITRTQNSFPVHRQFTGRLPLWPTRLLHSSYSPGQVDIISIDIWKYHTEYWLLPYATRRGLQWPGQPIIYWNSFLSLVQLLYTFCNIIEYLNFDF